jgi:hypothetical protein
VPTPAPPDEVALARATARLYAAAPDAFMTTRTLLAQEAKAAGDPALAREVVRLRKPTVAAWALNRAVRDHEELVGRLQQVGQRLRAAQARLDAARLKDLRAERETLLGDFVDATAATAAEAGRPLAPAVAEEVRATLIAALASEEATAAVVSGHLTRALRYSGFGEVDLSEAVARTSSGAVLTVLGRAPGADPANEGSTAEAGEAAGQEVQDAVDLATDALDLATHALEAATADVEAAKREAAASRERVEGLERELQEARTQRQRADAAQTQAQRARRAAEAARQAAQRTLADARARRGTQDTD